MRLRGRGRGRGRRAVPPEQLHAGIAPLAGARAAGADKAGGRAGAVAAVAAVAAVPGGGGLRQGGERGGRGGGRLAIVLFADNGASITITSTSTSGGGAFGSILGSNCIRERGGVVEHALEKSLQTMGTRSATPAGAASTSRIRRRRLRGVPVGRQVGAVGTHGEEVAEQVAS